MYIAPSILYSNNLDKVVDFLSALPGHKGGSRLDFFSKASVNLIDLGFVSKENISTYIKYLFKSLNSSNGSDVTFSKNFKTAISCICESPELDAHHLDELKPLVQFVIDNSYDFNSSAPKNKSYLMYRGWTGDDYGSIASLYLSNKSATIEHYKVVIESYLKLLSKEFSDFGSKVYSKISKNEFSNENIFKAALIKALSQLPENERAKIGNECLSFMDDMGCKIANENSNFILNCSVFSNFVDAVYATMNEQNCANANKSTAFDNDKVTTISDLIRNITTPDYNHYDLSSIDFKLIGAQHYSVILDALLAGIDKCKYALKQFDNESGDPSINGNITKDIASQLMTTLFLKVSTLIMSKGFNREHFEVILNNRLMDDLVIVDKDQALIYPLGSSPLWQYDDIVKHWDYLLKTDSLHTVIEASSTLSEGDIESLYNRFSIEEKTHYSSRNECESVIVSRLYNNHYAPKLIAGEKVAEGKLAKIMTNLLHNAYFNEEDLALFTKADLRKIIADPNCDVRKELSKPYNSAINDTIVSLLLNNAVNDIAVESAVTKRNQKRV
ncbi:hypothetical protein ACEUAI_13035 [Aeromonas veronii]